MLTRRLRFLLGLLVVVAFASPAQAQEGENLLTNPDFEGDFPRPEGDPFRVGEGWNAWYLDAPSDCQDNQPTFEPSIGIPQRNHAGNQATQIGIRGATFTAGIYQVVEGVESGKNYEFSIWGHVLYAGEVGAQESFGPDPRMKVGIDPTGGTNPFASTVRWSEVNWEFDSHFQFKVVAQAQGDKLTVFTYSTQLECLGSNFTFWDDAKLVATTLPETPAEIPGNPIPSFRATPADKVVTAAASEDAPEEPAEAPPEEASVPSGTGSICLLMFQDANANGSREVQEVKLAGGVFTLTDGSRVVATYTTDGISEPYCFSNLTPGNYMLNWQAQGYEGTGSQGWAVTLTEGETLSREFGAVAAAEGGGASGGSTGRLLRALAIAGGVVVFLLVAGVVVILLVSRRRADKKGGDSPPPPDSPGGDDADTILSPRERFFGRPDDDTVVRPPE